MARNRRCNRSLFYWILDSADTEKVTHEPHKSKLNHERVVQNHALPEKEKNTEIDAPRRALTNFGPDFRGPGDTQSSRKQILLARFFLLVFGCRKRGGGRARDRRNWRVVP